MYFCKWINIKIFYFCVSEPCFGLTYITNLGKSTAYSKLLVLNPYTSSLPNLKTFTLSKAV